MGELRDFIEMFCTVKAAVDHPMIHQDHVEEEHFPFLMKEMKETSATGLKMKKMVQNDF